MEDNASEYVELVERPPSKKCTEPTDHFSVVGDSRDLLREAAPDNPFRFDVACPTYVGICYVSKDRPRSDRDQELICNALDMDVRCETILRVGGRCWGNRVIVSMLRDCKAFRLVKTTHVLSKRRWSWLLT